jgi:hypothetical protein
MPSSRNRVSSNDWGVTELVRERPLAAAAAAAGAAAAGLFLWSKRSQISHQLSNLSDQIGEWTENMSSPSDDTAGLTTSGRMRSGAGSRSASDNRSRVSTSGRTRGMSETGGGNASLGRHSGGAGMATPAGGRGRAKSQPTT